MAAPFEPRVGTQLAGYQLQRLLARGGMGVVYLGIHERLHRPAAVKVLAPELAGDPLFRRRFLRECEVSVAIDHPNIIPVYDAGEFGDELYIAMRYVEGQDLRALLAERRDLPAEETIAIVTQIAAALDHAHARGLVHRDVKPANVLLTDESPPHCYLCDFGLTTFGSTSSNDVTGPATSTGELAGTVDYIAPERIAGNDAVPASDLYSLACLTVECLTGQPPFRRPTQLATLWAHMTQKPRRVAPDRELPAVVDTVLGRGLAKDPGDRPSSCTGFARELRHAAPPPRAATRVHGRRRRLTVATVAVTLLTIPLILLATRSDHTAEDRPRAKGGSLPPDYLGRISSSGEVTAAMPVPAGTIGVATSGGAVWAVSARGEVTRLDVEHHRATTSAISAIATGVAATDRSLWIAGGLTRSLVLVDADGSATTTRVGACCRGPWAVAASGTDAWVASNRSVIHLSGSSRTVKRLGRNRYNANSVTVATGAKGTAPQAWLADGQSAIWRLQWLHRPDPFGLPGRSGLGWRPSSVAAGWHSVWATVADPISKVVRLRTEPGTVRQQQISIPAGSPDLITTAVDGVWVADSARGTVWRIRAATNAVGPPISVGSRIGAIGPAPGGGVWVATTADDPSAAPGVIAFERNGNLFIQRPGGVARQITRTSAVEDEPTWSPDGSALAFTSDVASSPGIYVTSTRGAEPHLVAQASGTPHAPAWSPDGRTIAFVDSTGDTSGLYIADASAGGPRRVTDVLEGSALSWSPDGRRIAYLAAHSGEAPRVYVVSTGTEQSKLVSRHPAQAPAWSPDGSAIAFWTPRSGGTIEIAPLGNSGLPMQLASLHSRPTRITWSPDGRFLAASISRGGADTVELLRSDGTRLGALSGGSAAWGVGVPAGSVSSPASTS